MQLSSMVPRRGRQRVARTLSRLRSSDHEPELPESPALVSVIVPVYNVEAYLDECLGSVRSQQWHNLEILAVDDGSPDGSVAIAERHAREDPRIRIVHRPNGGLGAARNTGVREATGDYLCFVDSDDTLPEKAISALVESAEATGSDMVVGALARFDSKRRWLPEWTDLHAQERPGITVEDYPAIIRNNYSCGKLYRAAFWQRCGLWFREGVAYEDQPLVTQLYLRAATLDVVTAAVYNWRLRDDRSSISQQTHTLRDLRDRVSAWDLGIATLRSEAPQAVYEVWLRSLYATHFHWYLKSDSTVDDEYWQTLRDAIRRVAQTAPETVLLGIDPPQRVAVELARGDYRNEFHEFKRRGGYYHPHWPSVLESDGVVLELPTYDDVNVGLPRELYLIRDDEVKVVHRLDNACWTASGDLHVEGWAYFRSVDLSERPTRIQVLLRNDQSGDEVAVVATENPRRTPFPPVQDTWADYARAAFAADLPIGDRLNQAPVGRPGRWTMLLRVETDRLDRTLPVTAVLPGGSAAHLPPLPGAEGCWHRSDLRRGRSLQLHHLPLLVVAEQARADGATLTGRLGLNTAGKVVALRLVKTDSGDVVDLSTAELMDSGEFSFEVPAAIWAEPSSIVDAAAVWSLRALMQSGKTILVTAPTGFDEPLESREGTSILSWRPSHRGALTLQMSATTVVVESARLGDSGLTVTGRIPCLDRTEVTLQLVSVQASSLPITTTSEGGRFEVELPLRWRAWRYGEVTLPSSQYALTFALHGDSGEAAGEAQVSEELTSQFPASHADDRTALTLTRGPGRTLRVQLVPPVAPEIRGRFHINRLEQEHLALTSADTSEEREGLLIETNFGEIAGCNGIGIQRELERRSADVNVYWTVKDYSVVVPSGGIALVRNSLEWFEKLRTAKYLVDNMYQPPYHQRPPGQTIVATFHGYPFKRMGGPHWEKMQFSQSLIDSFHRRSSEWDYLVSPARYATPLLTRDWHYDGEVLEIGYPRNDVLVSAEADQIRAETQASLGIPDHVTVVLYAPTFRDYLSEDDHHASMGTFLDASELVDRLGGDHCLLIRGHAFHARTNERPDTADRIIDVTDYPDPADLYLASDVAILDYSSLRFDYAVTGKPMIFLVPDLELYEGTRGWLLDYASTAPGPLVRTTAEVAAALLELPSVVAEYAEAYEKFRTSYLDLEDGHASARFVDAVFVPRGDAPPAAGGSGSV